MKRSIKVVTIVVVLILIMSVASTAFASSTTFSKCKVYGGPSQTICTMARQRNINIAEKVTGVTWHGQSGWKLRGYSQSTGVACTELKSITGTGSCLANFTFKPATIQVKNSISSTNSTSYLEFSGIVYT